MTNRWASILILLALCCGPTRLQAEIRFTDVAGREVVLSQPAQRFVISEGRYVLTLALVRDNPVQGLVGMMQPIGWTYPALEQQVFERYPAARDIALFGMREAGSVSAEKIIELKPDVAIFGVQDHGPGPHQQALLQTLQAAGIAVVFIDFRLDPLHNTTRSIAVLGQVFGTTARAQRYVDQYESRRALIAQRLATVNARPRVFLQAHAGRFDCCLAMARGMLGPFVGTAGGLNIAEAAAAGPTSQHTPEYLLVENPAVWIGTASGTLDDLNQGSTVVTLGAGLSAEAAQHSLNRYLAAPEFQALDAVKTGRAHALWHDFYNSPLNIVALEVMARWIHPQTFADLDPARTLREIEQQFLPFSLAGTFWVSNQNPGGGR